MYVPDTLHPITEGWAHLVTLIYHLMPPLFSLIYMDPQYLLCIHMPVSYRKFTHILSIINANAITTTLTSYHSFADQMPPHMAPQFAGMRGPMQPGMVGSPLPPHMMQGMVQPPPLSTSQGSSINSAGNRQMPLHMQQPHPQAGLLPAPQNQQLPPSQQQPKSSFPLFTGDGDCVYIEDDLEFASTYESMASTFADCG